MFKILEYVKLSFVIKDGVKMAYGNYNTRIIVNKKLTDKICVKTSVRQGCPISPIIFALCLNPLCAMIIASSSVRGFRLQSCELIFLAYADDVAIFCGDKITVSNALALTEQYCDVTGSELNVNK